DCLTALQFQCVLKRDHGSEAGKRQSGCVDMGQAARLPADDGGLDGKLFRIGASCPASQTPNTASPSAMSLPSSPTALTTPEKSRPGIKGNFVCLYSPRRTFQSAALTVVATMSMTTSPGLATGSGKSPYWKTSGPPNRSIKAAFILPLPLRPTCPPASLNRGAAAGADPARSHQPRGSPRSAAIAARSAASLAAFAASSACSGGRGTPQSRPIALSAALRLPTP